MADEMVEPAQRFINSYNVPGIPKVEVNGKTSWTVMYALTRALQHELGITTLSDIFGPTTLSTLQSRFGPQIDDLTRHGNVYRIVQSALYCKGYDGGGMDGTYNDPVAESVAELKSNMGVGGASPDSGLPPKVFKALLTMDPYVRVGDGTEREVEEMARHELAGHRPATGLTGHTTDYASGTAVAIRPDAYPPDATGVLFPHQVAVVRDILKECEGVVSWGGRLRRPHAAHFQIAVRPGDPRLRRLALRIDGWTQAPGRGAGLFPLGA